MALNRIVPAAGPEYFKTYSLSAPLATHWRPATCEEYECDEWLSGMEVTVDLSTDLGQAQAHYIRNDRSRRATETQVSATLVTFRYPPGTECFEPKRSTHRVAIGRPPLYLVSEGDWRGNPRGGRASFQRSDDWIDDFANHQIKLAESQQRG